MKTFQEKLISSAMDYEGCRLLQSLIYEKGYDIKEIADLIGYKSKVSDSKYAHPHLYRILIGQASCSRFLHYQFKKIMDSGKLPAPEYKVVKLKAKNLNLIKIREAAFELFKRKGKHTQNKEICALSGVKYPVMQNIITKKRLWKEYQERNKT